MRVDLGAGAAGNEAQDGTARLLLDPLQRGAEWLVVVPQDWSPW